MTACPYCASREPGGYPRFPLTACVPCNAAYAADLRELADRASAIDRQARRLSRLATDWPEQFPAIRAAVRAAWGASTTEGD